MDDNICQMIQHLGNHPGNFITNGEDGGADDDGDNAKTALAPGPRSC